MICKVCGGNQFNPTEYRTGDFRAPALECSQCGAIALNEVAANSEEELDSVRRAVAARRSASFTYSIESGSQLAADTRSMAEIADACSQAERIVAELRQRLQVLDRFVGGDDGTEALSDAKSHADRIASLIDDIARRCAPPTQRSAVSGAAADPAANR